MISRQHCIALCYECLNLLQPCSTGVRHPVGLAEHRQCISGPPQGNSGAQQPSPIFLSVATPVSGVGGPKSLACSFVKKRLAAASCLWPRLCCTTCSAVPKNAAAETQRPDSQQHAQLSRHVSNLAMCSEQLKTKAAILPASCQVDEKESTS